MKKTNFFKKTCLAALVSSVVLSSNYIYATTSTNTTDPVAPVSTAILDFSSVEDFSKPIDLTEKFTENGVFTLGSGTLTFRVKNNGGFANLLGVSDPNSDVKYISFYSNLKGGKIQYGIEIRNGQNTRLIPNDQLVTDALPTSQTGFNTVTYSFDKLNRKIKIYVDGVLKKTANDSKFFEDIPDLSSATLGSMIRPNGRGNTLSGSIYHAGAIDDVLSEDAIVRLHKDIEARHKVDLAKQEEKLVFLRQKHDAMGAFLSEKYEIFKPGQGGANNYRIPGLLTAKDNVVIAAIDKRNQHASDWGNIDLAIRRSLDGGLTWENDKVVVDLATQPYTNLGAAESALVIDAVMTLNKETGRITMVFDMFPESQALFGMFSNSQASFESEGNGHVNVNGKWYRLLTDERGARYTVREDGIVYNRDGIAQDYRIVTEGDPNRAFKDLGDIIRISTGAREGNIFLRSKRPGHDSGPFNAHYTSYLWTTYSDDNGETWSSPVDITTQVKEDWMRFLGTGPGTGIQLKNGNIVVPVYFTNRDNKQSSAVIISKDGGKTWTRGESPNDAYLSEIGGSRYLNTSDYELTESQIVELNNGVIKMFSRNHSGAVIISTSHDGGMTWDKTARLKEVALLDPYSQMSVIKYSKLIDGKEYLVFANPHAGQRRNGMAWLGEVQDDGSIEWKYNAVIDPGDYAYNSLAELPNGDIGLLYEQPQGTKIQYVRFNLQELLWKNNVIYRDLRNNDRPYVNLDSIEEETYYKVGDGEMIKVGSGINPAKLIIKEGTATLNQTANDQGQKQAYKEIVVKERGMVRLGDNEQIDYGKLELQGGWVDINGNTITIEDAVEKTGLRSTVIDGHFVNLAEQPASIVYKVSGNNSINGTIDATKQTGNVDFIYEPAKENSSLTFRKTTILNVIDVKTGNVTYAQGAYVQANEAKVGNGANLNLESARGAVGKINLAEGSNMLVTGGSDLRATEVAIAQNANLTVRNSDVGLGTVTVEENANLTIDNAEEKWFGAREIKGKGKLVKEGQGTLLLGGNIAISHTEVKNGNVELINIDDNTPSSISGSLTVHSGATFGGSGKILADTIWKAGSIIAPGFNRPEIEEPVAETTSNLSRSAFRNATAITPTNSFKPETLEFPSVTNEGAAISLRVNNNSDIFKDWLHDKVIIKGGLTAENSTLVHLNMLGTAKANSDTNNNGKYDANEGLSLIQVHGTSDVGKFVIGNINSASADNAYQLALVSFEKEVQGLTYYDYQLHNKLITENGDEVSTIVRKPEPQPEAQPEPQPEAQPEPRPEVQPEPQPEVQPEPQPEVQPEPQPEVQPESQPEVQPESQPEVQPESQPEVQPEPQPEIQPEPQPEVQPEPQPEVQPAPAQPTPPAARTALNEAIPSYLVANIALMNQGDSIRDAFTSTLWTQNRKGFYVIQKYADAGYTSNLSFANYGYNYDSKQNATLFGGYIPVSNNTELHAGVGFSTLKVTPEAADGHSSARYKTTSLLFAMHNNWDNNVVLNTHLGYHWHRGTISSATRDIRVTGSQFQVGTEIGYNVKLNQVTLTPVAGISYQYLDVDNNWKLNDGAYKVFTQHVGSYLTWNTEKVNLGVGALYENNSQTNQHITIDNSQFATGKLGNSVLFKANAEVSILPQLKLGVQLEHRQGVSKAKLKQTSVQAQLNYQF